MPLKLQYNKTALQQIEKQLKMRLRALPTLKSKESALRVEVKKAKDEMSRLEEMLKARMEARKEMVSLWVEYNGDLLKVEDVKFSRKKIAGVNTPLLEDVVFDMKDFSLFNAPAWLPDGINIMKELAKLSIERDFYKAKMDILNYARKKTTQKVNLYEKVQIPEFENGIRKIKRFLEDEDNLSKSSQKIVKKKQEMEASEQ